MRGIRMFVLLLAAAAIFVPATSDAQKRSHTVTVQTNSGKTMELRMRRIGGQMMVLVPMSAACDVFHGMSSGC